MVDLPRNDVLFLPLLVAPTTTGRLPPSPWALPITPTQSLPDIDLPVLALADADASQPDAARDEARAGEDDGEKRAAGVEDEDLLDVLLRVQREDQLDPPLTTDTIKAIIIAGHLRGEQRDVVDDAPDEVRCVLAGQSNVIVTDYLPLVIKEALRLRECRSPCRVLGLDVPAGAIIETLTLKGRSSAPAGQRTCPGIGFGLANMELALASLLYHFDWELPDGAEPGELDMTEAPRLAHLVLGVLLPTIRVPLRGE
ncbi:hypothetical protein HU200_045741 [Digitaria exilis]|uniref:Uncharacterized protein n=1 Tax=Digitaria exilis TaxID=1010633 RepID=A0A835EFF7_9POAL|nr:hypothetical protein HU200_045741 [Digitaria exilis]